MMGNTIERRGRIIAPRAAHVGLSAAMPRVYAIASFDDFHSRKTQRAMRDWLRAYGNRYVMERVFAGVLAGKRTYDCYVYSSAEERSACFAYRGKEVGS